MNDRTQKNRRNFLKLLSAAGATSSLSAWPMLVQAQAGYPSKPVTVIAPFTAGGMTDVLIRRAAQGAATALGQPFNVENRTGAGGAVGAGLIGKAKNDGYTLGQFLGNQTLLYHMADVSYHPIRDFTFIIGLAATTMCVAVRGDSPYKTLADLVNAAKAKPDGVTMAHSGTATGGHIVAEEFVQLGVRFQQVPYKGAEWIQALLGGHVECIAGPIAFPSQIESGQFRLLAIFNDKRMPKFANTPTAIEQGYPITVLTPMGVMGPGGLDPRQVKTLHDAFKRWTDTPDYQNTLDQFLLVPWIRTSAETDAWVKEQFNKDKAFAERLGLAFKR